MLPIFWEMQIQLFMHLLEAPPPALQIDGPMIELKTPSLYHLSGYFARDQIKRETFAVRAYQSGVVDYKNGGGFMDSMLVQPPYQEVPFLVTLAQLPTLGGHSEVL